MILIDLQLGLFIVLVAMVALAFGVWWFTRPASSWRALPDKTGWQICQTLPFGVILLEEPGDSIVFMNPIARRLLIELGGLNSPEITKTLQRFNEAFQPGTTQRSGIIHQPVFIRWWRYLLDEDNSLLVLAEGGDQQRFLRQQAFIGQLVHELRTPLTALVAHTEIVAGHQTSEAVRTASMQTIQSGAQRMARLVRDMLELHRLETSEELSLQPTNLVLVAEDAIAQLILRAEDCGVTLNFDADSPLPSVLAHPDRLKQVFLNLIDNSIKYCRPEDEICVRLQKQPEGVLCLVQDNGPGIDATDLPHIMERFYRVRNRNEEDGMGLGLALVSEILRRHQTSFNIESTTEGETTGTTCQWLLPYVPTI